MLNRFLETKFHIPVWRTSGVPRPRLLERLQSGLLTGHKLALVSAPAGYGKTTLVTEWIHSLREVRTPTCRVSWLSLDEGDNDPARFLGYLVAALQRTDDTLGQSARSLLGMPQIPPPAAILDELVNELSGLEYRLILVLDDYHILTNSELHDTLEYFLEYLPSQVYLVLTSRADPPFPLARLRARGQMTEIRAFDLRFTLEEAVQFFNQSMRLNLETETVSALEARTEGWAAGLQLAALAMQNLPDRHDFLAGFNGSHRYIIDYLLDEVLNQQQPEIREFLSKTAVLKRFNAALCQAVTENTSSADILAQLERSNLFLIPLDDQRGWYRYHHLFADVLQTSLSPEAECEIRKRAAGWYEAEGLFAESISNWLASRQVEQAARLISVVAVELLKNGELQTLLGWLKTLPETAIHAIPDLAAYKAFSLMLTGQISLAREYAAQAFQGTESSAAQGSQGRLLAIRAWFANTSGDPHTGELARAALAQLEDSDRFFRTTSLIALGSSYAWDANLAESSRVFREAYFLGKQMNHPFVSLGALTNLAFNLLELGQLREAEALCRSALGEYVDSRGKPLPVLGILYSSMSSICFEKADFEEAEQFARLGSRLCHRLFSSAIAGGDNELILARVAFQRGETSRAFELLQSTAKSARERDIMMVVYKMAIIQVEFYLLQGNIIETETRLKELEVLVQSQLPKAGQVVAHLRARYWVATGKPAKALEILNCLEQSAHEEGCTRRLIGVYITKALAHQKQGNHSEARQSFETALRLAVPEGYRSVFQPYPGRPTLRLLQAARSIAPDFVDDILQKSQSVETASPQLPDPLSEQELNVLQLIVKGKSNQEIAGELVISVGTAKWHAHNIFRKLGVNNRAQAIARARELGIA